MSSYRPRKPLRERVAERKAGRLEEEDAPAPAAPWRKWTAWTGAVLQVIALVAVIIEALRMAQAGFVGADLGLVIVYLIIFFLGRILQLVARIRR